MARAYRCLSKQEFVQGDYRLVPIRDEDKYAIMEWRNEQIDILRQKEPLTKEKQDWYFQNVVGKLFEQERPEQLLFSFLEKDVLIGYGGLVHIDWESMNAEISFITQTERNSVEEKFVMDFHLFLEILISVAYDKLNFKKLHTTFYDLPSRIYYKKCIVKFGFVEEACLKLHLQINGSLANVFIYSHFRI
jgi:RimJ/RimL family protein N-acetyltransferase